MMRYFFLFCLLIALVRIQAQTRQDSTTQRPHTLTVGAALTIRGGLMEARWAYGTQKYQFLMLLDAAIAKNLKEEKIHSWYAPQRIGSDYYYGRLNRVAIVSPSFGVSRNIFPANHYNKINVRADVSVGPSLALLRPYFVNVNVGGAVVEEDDLPNSAQYSYEQIVGETNPFKNLSTRQTVVGISLRTALQLNLTRVRNSITAVQVGLNLDQYFSPLPLMISEKNSATYFTACIGMVWGRKV